MIKDKRYQRAVKQACNKVFNNKSSQNILLAGLISEFSHKSRITHGSYMLSKDITFFIVSKVLSQHWVIGRFAPCVLDFRDGYFYYLPNLKRMRRNQKKKVFDPFSTLPYVKQRSQKFYLEKKSSNNEPMPVIRGFRYTSSNVY